LKYNDGSDTGIWERPPVDPNPDPVYPPTDFDHPFGDQGRSGYRKDKRRRRRRRINTTDDSSRTGSSSGDDSSGEGTAITEDPAVQSNPTHYTPIDYGYTSGGGSTNGDETKDQNQSTPGDGGPTGSDDSPSSSRSDDSGDSTGGSGESNPTFISIPTIPKTGWGIPKTPPGLLTPSVTGTRFEVVAGNDLKVTEAVRDAARGHYKCWIICDRNGRWLATLKPGSLKQCQMWIRSTYVIGTTPVNFVLYEISDGVKEYQYEAASMTLSKSNSTSAQTYQDNWEAYGGSSSYDDSGSDSDSGDSDDDIPYATPEELESAWNSGGWDNDDTTYSAEDAWLDAAAEAEAEAWAESEGLTFEGADTDYGEGYID
jgi:hypothetical protein